MKIGIFTGTFDPFTIGHQNIAERALPMFDKLVIAVAMSKLKHASEEISKRVEDIKAVFPKECAELVDAEDASKGYRLEVVAYDDLTMILHADLVVIEPPGRAVLDLARHFPLGLRRDFVLRCSREAIWCFEY